jgi:hypothetical protein
MSVVVSVVVSVMRSRSRSRSYSLALLGTACSGSTSIVAPEPFLFLLKGTSR